jgi:hypothetical protein
LNAANLTPVLPPDKRSKGYTPQKRIQDCSSNTSIFLNLPLCVLGIFLSIKEREAQQWCPESISGAVGVQVTIYLRDSLLALPKASIRLPLGKLSIFKSSLSLILGVARTGGPGCTLPKMEPKQSLASQTSL